MYSYFNVWLNNLRVIIADSCYNYYTEMSYQI